MTYQRVIPRDFFNESKLLKCLGQLSLLILDGVDKNGRQTPKLTIEHDNEAFEIDHDQMLDGLYAQNVKVYANDELLTLYSPYNSKNTYPLLCYDDDGEIEVFNDDGTLTNEFVEFVS